MAALVQWQLTSTDIESAESYALSVSNRVVEACVDNRVKLVVFPELSGLWLLLTQLLRPDTILEKNVSHKEQRSKKEKLKALLPLLWQNPAVVLKFCIGQGGRALTDRVWKQHLEQWLSPFLEMARALNVYVCPGSTFLPPFQTGSRGKLFKLEHAPANTTCLISPHGKVLGFRRKLNLTPLERKLGFTTGDPAVDLLPFKTALGPIGITVCLDGFYKDIIRQLDMQGCNYILQPSANSIDWNEELVRENDVRIIQSKEWLTCGAGARIQGCEHILAAYNPMCVSRGMLLSNSGKSTAWVNCYRIAFSQDAARNMEPKEPDFPGLMQMAHSEYQEEILYAELPRV